MNCCRETTKMGVPPGNRPAVPRDWSRGVPERYVAGADTRGRQEGRPYPWSQQVIYEISGLKSQFGKSGVRASQVGIDHMLIMLNLFRWTLGNLGAKVQDEDAIRDIHHHSHIMFKENYGHSPFLVYVQDEACHVLCFFQIHTCHGFVQEQNFWLHCQGPGQ